MRGGGRGEALHGGIVAGDGGLAGLEGRLRFSWCVVGGGGAGGIYKGVSVHGRSVLCLNDWGRNGRERKDRGPFRGLNWGEYGVMDKKRIGMPLDAATV